MRQSLEGFFKALRGSDLPVSAGAEIDAVRALEAVGVGEREVLRHALGATLAASLEERAVFDECFDRFFSFDAFREPVPAPQKEARGAATLGELLLAGDRAGLGLALGRAARAAGVSDIWFFTQKGRYIQRIQEEMGAASLERHVDAGALPAVRRRLFEEVRRYVERQLALHGRAPARRLHEEFLTSRPLSHVERRDFERMHDIVRRMAKRLAKRHSRRRRRECRGTLDFRRTLRASTAHDGAMFRTYWKTRVLERSEVLALCDVSGSVAAHARFLLLFLYCLNDVLPRLRSFAFTDHLVETSEWFEALPVAQAVERVMREVGGGRTDYGSMLLDAREQLLADVNRRTTVLILGDARNNGGSPRSEVLELLYKRARRVVWLNPEPRAFWGLGDSEMRRYAPYCHVASHCSTLRHLERAIDRLLPMQGRP